jgi:ribokinase
MKKILVLGSLNIDLVQRVPRLPQPGETLPGEDLQTFPGGKGANQACAAALLGGQVQMAGCVGNDVFAGRLIQALETAGVDAQLVRSTDAATGSAVIFILPNGENSIVISPGANAAVSTDAALAAIETLNAGDLLLCQLEIPLDVVESTIRLAHEKQIVTLLDPAPARPLPDGLLSAVSILTPNQTEAAILAECSNVPADMRDAATCAQQLHMRGAATIIIKMGEQGCLISNQNGTTVGPGFKVDVIDTTAAGDTFNGALAVALANGENLPAAAAFANAAAALSVTKLGAISSIPSRSEVDRFLASASARA